MKHRLVFILLSLITSVSFAQESLVNSVKKGAELYHEGKYAESILHYDSASSWPHLYYNSMMLWVNRAGEGDSTAAAFIHLYSNSDVFTARYMKPVDYYLQTTKSTNKEELVSRKDQFLADLKVKPDSSHLESLFQLAAYFYFRNENVLSNEEQKETVRLLQRRNLFQATGKFNEGLALKKYLSLSLLDEQRRLGEVDGNAVLDVIMTPQDLNDLGMFRIVENRELGFQDPFELKKSIILEKLEEDKTDEVLRRAVYMVAEAPSTQNIEWIQTLFDSDEQFRIFWTDNVHTKWPEFKGNERINHYIDSLTTDDMWVVLDIWGTWCSPCIKEMPEMAEMGEAFDRLESQPIKFLTLSYQSKEIEKFMEENNYHFPYIETTKEDMKEIKVHSYPTLLLIASNGKYVKIPTNANKEEMIRAYTMLVW